MSKWLLYDYLERVRPELFFFHDPAPTEIYTLSLHDALPVLPRQSFNPVMKSCACARRAAASISASVAFRSEEHTSELQSHVNLVCRLLLEKKNQRDWSSFLLAYRRVFGVARLRTHTGPAIYA